MGHGHIKGINHADVLVLTGPSTVSTPAPATTPCSAGQATTTNMAGRDDSINTGDDQGDHSDGQSDTDDPPPASALSATS